jgi:hypothetical protein
VHVPGPTVAGTAMTVAGTAMTAGDLRSFSWLRVRTAELWDITLLQSGSPMPAPARAHKSAAGGIEKRFLRHCRQATFPHSPFDMSVMWGIAYAEDIFGRRHRMRHQCSVKEQRAFCGVELP